MTLQKFRNRPTRRIRNPKQRSGARLIFRIFVAIPEDAERDEDGDHRDLHGTGPTKFYWSQHFQASTGKKVKSLAMQLSQTESKE